jgi:hypothetical protein
LSRRNTSTESAVLQFALQNHIHITNAARARSRRGPARSHPPSGWMSAHGRPSSWRT